MIINDTGASVNVLYERGLDGFMPSVEEVEPDEWDLEMIASAKRENDGSAVPIEDLAAELGIEL